jgi:hypothetical protein
MDVFAVHEQVIADYRAFTSGFVEVRDKHIKAFVDQQFDDGVQWPDPWVGLNPSFATGWSVPELVRDGLLHPETERIFRRKTAPQDAGRDPLVLHRHQRQAVEIARTGASYVLTTGAGGVPHQATRPGRLRRPRRRGRHRHPVHLPAQPATGRRPPPPRTSGPGRH